MIPKLVLTFHSKHGVSLEGVDWALVAVTSGVNGLESQRLAAQ
ncbi:hypothetical protein [Olivibacter sp. SDN3]|nr:hypothetical protein [Olivibacter sp. SDN3]